MKWIPLADLLIHVHERNPGTSARPSWASVFGASPSKPCFHYTERRSLAQVRYRRQDFFLKTLVF